MKKVALIANSAAGRNQLTLLVNTLEKAGVVVSASLTANDTVCSDTVFETLKGSDAVVIGMAPSEEAAVPELQAVQLAHTFGIPVFLYADTFGVVQRPWFSAVRSLVSGVFVVAESEAGQAAHLFPQASIHVTGNPEWWAGRVPGIENDEARSLLGVSSDEHVILFGGTKQEFADLHVLGELVNACMRLPDMHVQVLYPMHPGTPIFGKDKMDEMWVRGVLQRVVRVPQNKEGRVKISVVSKEITTEQVHCAADIVAESMSHTGILAALRKQPLITFLTPMLEEHLVYLQGGTVYPLVDQGASILAPAGYVALSNVLQDLFTDGKIRAEQRIAQEKFISMGEDPCDAMVKFLCASS